MLWNSLMLWIFWNIGVELEWVIIPLQYTLTYQKAEAQRKEELMRQWKYVELPDEDLCEISHDTESEGDVGGSCKEGGNLEVGCVLGFSRHEEEGSDVQKDSVDLSEEQESHHWCDLTTCEAQDKDQDYDHMMNYDLQEASGISLNHVQCVKSKISTSEC